MSLEEFFEKLTSLTKHTLCILVIAGVLVGVVIVFIKGREIGANDAKLRYEYCQGIANQNNVELFAISDCAVDKVGK